MIGIVQSGEHRTIIKCNAHRVAAADDSPTRVCVCTGILIVTECPVPDCRKRAGRITLANVVGARVTVVAAVGCPGTISTGAGVRVGTRVSVVAGHTVVAVGVTDQSSRCEATGATIDLGAV